MGETGWTFRFFETSDGTEPVKDFLQTLKSGEKAQILARLQMVQIRGLGVGEDVLEILGNNLYALRAPNTPNNPRIFMCAVTPKILVAVHGYAKHTDKIPVAEMRIAQQRVVEVEKNPKRYKS